MTGKKASKPTPEGGVFAIGDIHGCADELNELLHKLPIRKDSTVVFLGDFVDRGPQSRQVIETAMEMSNFCTVIPLLGNHEAMFLEFIDGSDPRRVGRFIYNGGSSTLASYADDRGIYTIPADHIEWLMALKLSYEIQDYYFVHAGLPDVDIDKIDILEHADEMLWTRRAFFNSSFQWSKTIVHGHTPVHSVEIMDQRINLDTGCVYDGRLTAMEFPSRKVYDVARISPVGRIFLRDKESRRAALRFKGELPVVLYRGEDTLPFETVDYSELGLYLRDRTTRRDVLFAEGERVKGCIGPDDELPVQFEGEIIRIGKNPLGVHYAIRLDRAPGPQGPEELDSGDAAAP